jgi:hypothetical protein
VSRWPAKNNPLGSSGKSPASFAHPALVAEGRIAIVTNVEAGSGGPQHVAAREHDPEKWKPVFRKDHARLFKRTDERCGADGEVAWSRYPDAGIKSAAMLAVSRRRWWPTSPVHQGERQVSRQTIAQGRPGVLGCTCGSAACFLLHATMGASRRPVFPAPSRSRRVLYLENSDANRVARTTLHIYSSCPAQSGHPVRRGASADRGRPGILDRLPSQAMTARCTVNTTR